MKRQFGRIESPDIRDNDFLVSAILTESPIIRNKFWDAEGWWGDQGTTSQCVCYSWLHWIEDGPVKQNFIENRSVPLFNPTEFYDACQKRDQWEGECVDTATECLTKNGWKKYDELQINEEIYCLDLETQTAKWGLVQNVNIFENAPVVRMFNSTWDIVVTENHNWVVRNRINKTPFKLVKTNELNSAHEFMISAKNDNLPENPMYTDEFVLLMAWVLTEGHLRKSKRKQNSIAISQQKYSSRLKEVLHLNGIHGGYWNNKLKKPIFICEFGGDIAKKIRELVSNEKIVDLSFIHHLTENQLKLFIDECILGDGSIIHSDIKSNRKERKLFHQNVKTGNVLDCFILACTLLGINISRTAQKIYVNNTKNSEEIQESWGLRTSNAIDLRTFKTESLPNQTVWCPTTTYGTFLARRNGKIFFTGNSYNGTSVRAAAKILKKLGVISEYRWAKTVDDTVNTILMKGPMVVGTRWYANMTRPNANGFMKPSGAGQGGHAYVINGVDVDGEFFRIKNSWGKRWGKKGFAYISFSDFEKLLENGGEACIAEERVVSFVSDFKHLPAPYVLGRE